MKRLTGLAAIATIVVSGLMMASLSRGATPYPFRHQFPQDVDSPVLAIEIANDLSDVAAVLRPPHSTPAERHAAEGALRLSTVLDLLFIPLYTAYLVLLARLFGCPGKPVVTILIGAAVADYVEDFFIFATLDGRGPLPFGASLVKWGLLAAAFVGIGLCMLRGREVVYSFVTESLLGLAHVGAGVLIVVAIVLGPTIGYSLLEVGTAIFAVTVVLNAVGLLGPTVGRWFPGRDIAYVDDFCRKRQPGHSTWGAPGAPQAPRPSERPGEAVALLDPTISSQALTSDRAVLSAPRSPEHDE